VHHGRAIARALTSAALLTVAPVTVAAEPVVVRASVNAMDAPELDLTDHGITGQDVCVSWCVPGPGAAGEPALYAFCDPAGHRRDPEERFLSAVSETGTGRQKTVDKTKDGTPVFVRVDFGPGTAREFFLSNEPFLRPITVTAATAVGADDDGFEVILPVNRPVEPLPALEPLNTWPWTKPVAAKPTFHGGLLIGTANGELVVHLPDRNAFLYFGSCEKPLRAFCAAADGACWAVAADNILTRLDRKTGRQTFPDAFAKIAENAPVTDLVSDASGLVYALLGTPPSHVVAAEFDAAFGGDVDVRCLRKDMRATSGRFSRTNNRTYLVLTSNTAEQWFLLDRGKIIPVKNGKPDTADADYQYEWQTLLAQQPPVVRVKRKTDPETAWREIAIQFSRADMDSIKTLRMTSNNARVLGANYPYAWIWDMDVRTGQVRRHSRDYVWYEMQTAGDDVYAIGYYGIKLLRWNPEKPWTMDSVKDNPGRETAWGPRTSNPWFMTNFRFMWNLNIRRPSGLAIDRRGRVYAGGHDAAYTALGEGVRILGALFCYDPGTEEISAYQLTHDHVHDVCAVGRYVAVGVGRSLFRYEPPPDDDRSGFWLFDTESREFSRFETPLDGGPVMFVEQSSPGILIGGGPLRGKYAEKEFGCGLFRYDTKTLKTTHVIKMVGHFGYSAYAPKTRFERGPDGCIYFYTQKPPGHPNGPVLFRLDPESGQVAAVARGKGISDSGVFLRGPSFAFGPERVYFAAGAHLLSAPLKAILGQ